jgi:hypothetical protein
MRLQHHPFLFLIVLSIVTTLSTAGASNILADAKTPTAVAGDPIWCPLGVVPVSGSGGCSPSFGTLSGLIIWLGTHDPDQSGVIWIERAYDSSGEGVAGFILDGASFVHFDTHDLTIQGGWNGLGTNTVDHGSPSALNGDFLHIDHWNASVTVNDILVNRPAAIGIDIQTTAGGINLANVVSQNSIGGFANGDGAELANDTGTGNVTVNDSSFNGNGESGLGIYSSGTIALSNVTANSNGNNFLGALLDNRTSTTAQPVTLTGTSIFNGNGAGGIDIFSHGPIEVHDITSNANLITGGVYLDNTSAVIPQPVNLIGTNHLFRNNAGAGLVINSHGVISTENVDAWNNGGWGAVLNNGGTGSTRDLTLAGQSSFSQNGQSGLNAFSNGVITLSGVTTERNESDGVMVGTPGAVGMYCAKDYSNGGFGVNAATVRGRLTLNDVTLDGHNASGDYSYPGTATIESGGCVSPGIRGLRTIKIINDSVVTLDCSKFNGTEMILPDGRRTIFYCPTLGDVTLRFEKIYPFPVPLPDEKSFISGLDISLKEKGIEQKTISGPVTISFVAPNVTKGTNFSILYLDGKQWVDLNAANFNDGRKVFNGGYFTNDGYFEASTNFSGEFALVQK